jgi:glycogen debranching enzyme
MLGSAGGDVSGNAVKSSTTGGTRTVGRRPTPLDPYPEAGPRSEAFGKAAPSELGSDAIAVLEGRSFMFSDSLGDVPPGSVGGLLHEDTRFLSRWQVTLGGRPLSLLKSGTIDYNSAGFYLTNPDLPGLPAYSVAVRRLRRVGGGAIEQIAALNTSSEPVVIELRLGCGADFADLFEVRSAVRDRTASIATSADPHGRSLRFRYGVPGFLAETTIEIEQSEVVDQSGERVSAAASRVEAEDVVWELELPPRYALIVLAKVCVRVNRASFEPVHDGFGALEDLPEGALTDWLERVPRLESASRLLDSVVEQSVRDLAALRITGELLGETYVLPAAGLPWFMTLFGRDTLITSLQTIWVGPGLARGALHLLGALQGTRIDEFHDEEPGKIMHEVRSGELTLLGEKPHSPYYGTADATPLWLILLSEYWRFSGLDEFVRVRWHHVLAALGWIDRHGDRDGDGYVEYQTRSSEGLGNQCWKDSWDGIQFADGRIPFLPIATAEIQGYVYDAKLRVAELARAVMGDAGLGARLEGEASRLYDRFNEDFWSEARGGYYVVGLDCDKRPIDSMTSNMGHLLWSGIVPAERAQVIAAHLMSAELFSGWGVRTMSVADRGYNPIGYHIGTVWPHDNAIVAQGLARYGFREEANRIAQAQFEAAAHTGFRLPEAFSGFERWISRFPVPYPTACSPQAWATGAPFVFVRAMLGLDARSGELRLDPYVPQEMGRIRIHRLHAFGAEWDVEAAGTSGEIRPADAGRC